MSTAVIAVAQVMMRADNLSLVYLLVVLWLASVFGRGPAVLASVLAFFAYDFFFLPPLYRLTVDDPTEWISLGALLTTSLVLGSLTASVRTQAREARESQQRTAMLYGLSQLIAATTKYDALITALTKRVLEVFGPDGVVACTLIRLDEHGEPVTQAAVTATGQALLPAVTLEEREQRAQALWVIEHGMTAGGACHRGGWSFAPRCMLFPAVAQPRWDRGRAWHRRNGEHAQPHCRPVTQAEGGGQRVRRWKRAGAGKVAECIPRADRPGAGSLGTAAAGDSCGGAARE